MLQVWNASSVCIVSSIAAHYAFIFLSHVDQISNLKSQNIRGGTVKSRKSQMSKVAFFSLSSSVEKYVHLLLRV